MPASAADTVVMSEPRAPERIVRPSQRRRTSLALAAALGLLALVGFGASMIFTGESPEEAPATPESNRARTTTGDRQASTETQSPATTPVTTGEGSPATTAPPPPTEPGTTTTPPPTETAPPTTVSATTAPADPATTNGP